jgi:pyridoxal phosphate-dependent aminotransferase EpsN
VSRIYLSPPHLAGTEGELLSEALDSNWIAPLGPQVEAFEREFSEATQVPHCLALSSGTAALHLALRLLGVGPGDDVLCPTLTFVATANAVLYLGGRPVFIDSERDSWNMDPILLAQELDAYSRRAEPPRAVVVVDLYGQSADYEAIASICDRHRVPLVEDAAEALGATFRGKPVGGFGKMGIFSFNGNKIITTSGGGMLVSHHRDLVDRARVLAAQARDPAPHYEHSVLGYNYRLSNLLAAVGRAQLRVLAKRVERRREVFAAYVELLEDLPGIAFMPEAPYGRATRWLTCITVEPDRFGTDREAIRLALENENIEARPLWKPMHLQPLYRDCRVVGGSVAARLFEHGLCLPSGTALTEADLQRIASIIRDVHRSKRR